MKVMSSIRSIPTFAFAAFVFSAASSWAHDPDVRLTGIGTALIDGAVAPGEWDSAGCREFPVNVPEGVTTPGTVCAMNDQTNLYLLIRFRRTTIDGNSAAFEFDNDHDVTREPGDDVLLINPSIGFFDEVRSTAPPCPPEALCGFFDTTLGGTNDGAGTFANDGTFSTYEFSHPLDSADDANDFSLSPGSTVGFGVFVRLLANGVIADTVFPLGFMGDIVIASPTVHVAIDIKPHSRLNRINPRSHGWIPVAIFSSATFDAAAQINQATLTFGRTGDERSFSFCYGWDVNRDNRQDLVCYFRTRAAGFKVGDTKGILKGATFSEMAIEGSDGVHIVRKKHRR